MYEKCNRLFVEDEKPPDLRFFMARAYVDQQELKKALAQLDKLAALKLSNSQKAVLFQLKGHIFISQKRYLPAAKMFASALGYETDACRRSDLLMDRANALEAAGDIKASLTVAAEVIRNNETCGPLTGLRLKQAGQMHLENNDPKTAIAAFKKALAHVKTREDEIRIKFLMAKGYEAIRQKDDYLALYNEIAQLEDPFWSNLAREKLEEIKFKRDFENQPKMNKG
jgi:tetratricopeptide (TPR) repeat protein